jgi:flagellar hook assembly protein FlgD
LSPIPTPADNFYVSKNIFSPSAGPVSIYVKYDVYPGNYSLNIYNSAGEHIKTLDDQNLNGPVARYYSWDGTNKFGETVASGVYLIYLLEPFDQKMKRVLFLR